MPLTKLTIRCTTCHDAATFECANILMIKRKLDIPYFDNSKHFEVIGRNGWSKYKLYYHAVHYPGISPQLSNIDDLPEGCEANAWSQGLTYPNFLHDNHAGSKQCQTCKIVSKHTLKWPQDAFFKITYKGQILWAYDRLYAVKLLAYIKSEDRKKRIELSPTYIMQDAFLRKIPTHFQTAKARNEVVKKLEKLLA